MGHFADFVWIKIRGHFADFGWVKNFDETPQVKSVCLNKYYSKLQNVTGIFRVTKLYHAVFCL